ncbi:unnamed protein product [Meganyctiphanes norvegica]|uniref:Proline-rich protein PRCC n=1 Tax=Meganyctiphanes norvegica TaxID=48144 RepID=A0AAV2Q4M9_MEGNR
MALVAYSDDSDIESDEEINEETSKISNYSDVNNKSTSKKAINDTAIDAIPSKIANGKITSNTNTASGIDSIVDEDEEEYINTGSRGHILDSIPAARSLDSFALKLDVDEETDIITDVPTVDTWALIKELKEKNILPDGRENKSSKNSNAIVSSKDKEKKDKEQELKKKKIQFIIPSLSEFSDDEEEEKIEPEKKKIKASAQGTGLFSLLPEPKTLAVKETKRSLVPHVLTKRPTQSVVKKKPKPKPTKKIDDVGSESEDDDDGTGDFFSLSSKDTEPAFGIGVPVNVSNEPELPELPKLPEVRTETRQPPTAAQSQVTNLKNTQYDQLYTNELQVQTHVEESTSGYIPFSEDNSSESSNSSHGMDEEAIRRLMGKRGKLEAINFIDVSADDALLTRDEWMTKALSEEKPTHSFSKKREGLPSQKQKQKHQITYLAHQAKERELELKNNWASNRQSKLQTQAKYGF